MSSSRAKGLSGNSRKSSVFISTRYGLGDPEIVTRCGVDFRHPSRPTLGPTQPPVQWATALFPGGGVGGKSVRCGDAYPTHSSAEVVYRWSYATTSSLACHVTGQP